MRKGRLFFVTIFAATAAVAGVAACTIVDGLTVPAPVTNVPEASADAGDFDSNPCGNPGYPTFSATATSSPTDAISFLVAVSKLDFGAGTDAGLGGPFGYNLDHVCTCPQAKSCTSNYPDCDQASTGADNAVSGLINGQAQASGYNVQALTQDGLNSGKNGLLIQVEQYNGLADDSSVSVNFYGSTGTLVETSDGGGGSAVSYDAAIPTFTSSDIWSVTDESVINPTEQNPAKYIAKTQAASAYVAGFTLVALMDSIDVPLAPNVTAHLSDVAVTAKIIGADGGPYKLTNGVVTGRWAVADAITNIGNIYVAGSGYVCTLGDVYDEIHGAICDAVDISAVKALDNQGSACNALSVGIRYESVGASFGPILAADSGLVPCILPEGGPACL